MSKLWTVVIFACRETLTMLSETTCAARVAARGKANIDIVVNGNPKLAIDIFDRFAALPDGPTAPSIRVWSIKQGDKANAWNHYLQHIWCGEEIAFFIDGYVRLNPDSVVLLGDAVAASADVLGGTGVPSVGRTAKAMRKELIESGGFHGNFCCIKGDAIAQLRQRRIQLPFGLYRVDSLMGALLSFGLHPELGDWNRLRIFVHPDASWQNDPKHWWRLADLHAKFKRVLRQARGILENEAVKDHFVARRQSPELLPTTTAALVLAWANCRPQQLKKVLWGNPLARIALAQMRSSPNELPDGVPPKLVTSKGVL